MLTLNLLRNARVNPNLLSHKYIFGHYNYKATPIAPPGMKMVVHLKPSQRGSWDPHWTIGFYVGSLALSHYRCFRCYIPSTKSEQISDTITFLQNKTPVPSVSTAEKILDKLKQLLASTKTSPKTFSFIPTDNNAMKSIQDIKKISQIMQTNCHRSMRK